MGSVEWWSRDRSAFAAGVLAHDEISAWVPGRMIALSEAEAKAETYDSLADFLGWEVADALTDLGARFPSLPGELARIVNAGQPTHRIATYTPGVYAIGNKDCNQAMVGCNRWRRDLPYGPATPLLTATTYEWLIHAIDYEVADAVTELGRRLPWVPAELARMSGARQAHEDDEPASVELWQAEAGHPQLTKEETRVAFDAAWLHQGQCEHDRMEVLFRWAWHCPMRGRRCLDAPRRRLLARTHVYDHLSAFQSANQAWADSYWPIHHWREHLDGRGCPIERRS